MLDRNRRIKAHPERFQETEEEFDLVVTVEERVYDQVIECKYPCYLLYCLINQTKLSTVARNMKSMRKKTRVSVEGLNNCHKLQKMICFISAICLENAATF